MCGSEKLWTLYSKPSVDPRPNITIGCCALTPTNVLMLRQNVANRELRCIQLVFDRATHPHGNSRITSPALYISIHTAHSTSAESASSPAFTVLVVSFAIALRVILRRWRWWKQTKTTIKLFHPSPTCTFTPNFKTKTKSTYLNKIMLDVSTGGRKRIRLFTKRS